MHRTHRQVAPRLFRRVLVAGAALFAAGVQAVTFSGSLDDPTNVSLVSSTLQQPSFVDDLDVANNVAVHAFDLSTAGSVAFRSAGYGAGGIDPYFTLFRGSGASAVFVLSNHLQAFSTGGDFELSTVLDAGAYSVAIGTFANLSFAENLGFGTLADGFIGLGQPQFLGNGFYELRIDAVAAPVPEPSIAVLFGIAGAMLVLRRKPSKRN